ncbi:alpha/beta hydrolase fold domain-containing protein [Trujillonella humicola]|uniref:alpha/beta hydrolase fold domain-containing protein n=1 Tax=Trujillonella humicola TaxID=3383699 RepID=UPI003906CE49
MTRRSAERRRWGFLCRSVLSALATVVAFRPLSTTNVVAAPLSFVLGLPSSELPLHSLAAQVGGTAVAVGRGRVRGAPGVLGLALRLGAWAGLVVLHRRALRSGEVLDAALAEALGPDYRDHVVDPRPPVDPTVQRRPGVVRMARIWRRYVHDGDLSYGDAGPRNMLDIWRRPDVGPGAPVLLQIPGGAWVMGNKRGQAHPLMSHLVERGWICVSITTRLSPASTWPDHVVDVKKAIAWIRANIAGYGGDPGFIAVSGGSSGGHLTALAALTAGDRQLQPGFEDADTTVQAAVPLYGVYDWSDRTETGGATFLGHVQRNIVKAKWDDDPAPFRQASPIERVHADAPPFFVVHGINDSFGPAIVQPRSFVPRLRAVSRNVVAYAELPDAQHAFDTWSSPRAVATAEAIGRFLGVVYGEHRAAAPHDA